MKAEVVFNLKMDNAVLAEQNRGPLSGPCGLHGRQQPLHHQEREGPRQRGRRADASGVRERGQEAAIVWERVKVAPAHAELSVELSMT